MFIHSLSRKENVGKNSILENRIVVLSFYAQPTPIICNGTELQYFAAT